MDARSGPEFSVVMLNIPSSSPRPFRFAVLDTVTRTQMLLGGFLALFGLLASVILTVEGGPFWHDLVLDRRGVDAQGTPTSIEPTGHTVNDRRVYRVAYTFKDRTRAWRVGSGYTTDCAKARAEASTSPVRERLLCCLRSLRRAVDGQHGRFAAGPVHDVQGHLLQRAGGKGLRWRCGRDER